MTDMVATQGSTLSELATQLPASLSIHAHTEQILIVTLTRTAKRNALDDITVLALGGLFDRLPDTVRVVVVQGEGDHFSAGLDLTELVSRNIPQGIAHSRSWHRVFDNIEFGTRPVIAVLKGAVIGGGLELACTAHVRVAETTAFYALPEGQRGIFVGGGGSVRLPRLIGASRMMEMMLTGHSYDSRDGQAMGLSHHLVETGQGLPKALELAERIAGNAPMTNFAVMHALPRIADADPGAGYLMESLMAAIAQGDEEAKRRINDFLAKRAGKVAAPR